MFDADLLGTRAAVTPDRTALSLTDADQSESYRDLDRAVTETASALAAIEPDATRLAAVLPAGSPFVCQIHAAARLGWELAPLNTRLSAPELAGRLDRLDADLVVCGPETESLAAEAQHSRADPPAPRVSVGEPAVEDTVALPRAPDRIDPSPRSLTETALILFTSGTTGAPKGVRLTTQNLVASAVASAFRLGVTPTDRWLCCLPMYHMGGLAPVVRSTLYGTELLVQPGFEADRTATVLEEAGVTGVSLVPTQLSRLLDVGLSAPDLRTVLLGGAPAAETLLERADEAGLPVWPTYGMTETTSQIATACPGEHRRHPGTVGQPLYGTRVAVVADDEVVGPGERGEFVVSGPTVSPGYLDSERTERAWSAQGLHTGDLGYRDEDGRLWVLGRLDDTIITGGELVAPATVAETIRAVSGVDDVAVVGIDDEEWGQRVAAAVVAAGDSAGLVDRIESHCRDHLAGYKLPRELRVVDALPRTQSGTVDREAVRDLF